MFEELINTYTNNSYLIAISYLIIWFLIIRLSLYVLQEIIFKIILKKKIDVTNPLISKTSRSITLIVFFIGIKIAVNKLPWSIYLINNLNLFLNTFLGILAVYLFYVIFDLSFTKVVRDVSKKTLKTNSNEGLLQLTKSALQVILVLVGIIYILGIWGIQIAPILAGIGVAGIAIAFALQSSLGNVFGGISIILDNSVKVGDLVNLSDGTAGIIEKIGIRSTRIKTFDNELIIVPNSKLADSNIKNIAQPEPKSRVVIPFHVAYGSDVEKVKKLVMKEILSIKDFVNEPAPLVRFLEFGESALKFKAYFFVSSYEQRFNAIDEINTKIYTVLRKNKIEIPYPKRDIYLKK